jgi:amino acid adenylation domain-containing protein
MLNWVIEQLTYIAKNNSEQFSLVARGLKLTYKEMLDAVFGLAEELKGRGIKKGDVCVVLCDRNANTFISIFAVWAIGGIYCPISLETPLSRNNYIIQNTDAKVIIDSTIDYSCKSSFANEYTSLILHPSFKPYAGDAYTYQHAIIANDDTAYIIFTSGSTGKPKGAKISHKNLSNLHEGLKHGIYSHYPTNMNIALVAPFTFDASIQQIVSPILLGHTIYITQENQRRNPDKLHKFICENGINLFDCTPTHIKMLNGVIKDSSILGSKIMGVIVGGEALKADVINAYINKFVDKVPDIINIYGVTECSVDSVFNFLNPKKTAYRGFVPIGNPMYGVEIIILDEHGNLVEKGKQGELAIGGTGVGLGYLDESLNEDKFIQFGDTSKTFYKTGDVAFVNENGMIVCLGRTDRQVKIRGNRVELSDIEV